jgi:hypothetical protein
MLANAPTKNQWRLSKRLDLKQGAGQVLSVIIEDFVEPRWILPYPCAHDCDFGASRHSFNVVEPIGFFIPTRGFAYSKKP